MRSLRIIRTMTTMRLPRRPRNQSPSDRPWDIPDDGRLCLDPDGDHRPALRPEQHRSIVAAVDSAIAAIAGGAALPAGEVIDLLLDLRTRIVSAAA